MAGFYDLAGLPRLPVWDWERWFRSEPQRTHPTKERFLRESLRMAKGLDDNERVCREVVEKALEAGLFDVAFEALRTFSQQSSFHMCVSVRKVFVDMSYWQHLDEFLVDYCIGRVLRAKPCRSAFGTGGHFREMRSRTLGYLGRYRFFTGQPEAACWLWDAAHDRRDVDEVIADVCRTIVRHSPENTDVALELLEVIETPDVRAETIVSLSKRID